jgi:transcriptional regulator with XRE-family HTH domain
MIKARKYSSDAIKRLREQSSPADLKKIDTKMALSARIADEINSKFDSKGAFANAMGVSQGLVSRWLSGTHNFTIDTLIEIELVLGIRLIDTDISKAWINESHHRNEYQKNDNATLQSAIKVLNEP